MSITLAATWHPRGETLRFRRLYPMLAELYDHLIVVVPPQTHTGMILSFKMYQKLQLHVVDEWAHGRYTALQLAVERDSEYIHYADLDRLIRWAETNPDELKATVRAIEHHDCLVIGRTERAYATHPQALIQTEAMSNAMFSHILGQKLDLSSGSKGFRHATAAYVVKHGQKGNPFGTDAEWVILSRRGGFEVSATWVEGLDWESADRYSTEAADDEQQMRAAAEYDADPKNWKHRVMVANEIVNAGLATFKREL